jgi:hypothetical protein
MNCVSLEQPVYPWYEIVNRCSAARSTHFHQSFGARSMYLSKLSSQFGTKTFDLLFSQWTNYTRCGSWKSQTEWECVCLFGCESFEIELTQLGPTFKSISYFWLLQERKVQWGCSSKSGSCCHTHREDGGTFHSCIGWHCSWGVDHGSRGERNCVKV